jgi:hypothetical protein
MEDSQSNGEPEWDAGLSGVHEWYVSEPPRNLSVGDGVEYKGLGDHLEEIVG